MTPILHQRLGSMLAEQFDFGTAKSINSLFLDLAEFTPFSKTEEAVYSRLLNDRNLLVHHGGVYTMRYFRQRMPHLPARDTAFWDGLSVTKASYREHVSFLTGMASKIFDCTAASLTRIAESPETDLPDYYYRALDYLTSGNPISLNG